MNHASIRVRIAATIAKALAELPPGERAAACEEALRLIATREPPRPITFSTPLTPEQIARLAAEMPRLLAAASSPTGRCSGCGHDTHAAGQCETVRNGGRCGCEGKR